MSRVLLVPDLPIERWPSMDRYAIRLARGLREEAPDLTIDLAGKVGELTVDHPGPDGASHHSHPTRILPSRGANEWRRYLWRYGVYPARIKTAAADVVHVLDHSYAHVLRAKKHVPSLITVHDLLPVLAVQRRTPHWRDAVRNWFLQRVLASLRRADAWIVATEWLRAELATWLEVDERIHVIPFGVDEAFFAPAVDTREVVRDRWGIPHSGFVVLHVGSVTTRKNFSAVIAAVDGLRAGGVDAWLLQVGGVLSSEDRADIEARHLGDAVEALGAAGEADLRAAYRAADVLLFPSHYEGFGFPILEAMASELPVITSGAGGLSEVAGDAAIIVGGREVEPYTAALRRILEDREYRATLVRNGVARAKQFRWTETARRTAALYRRMSSGRQAREGR